MSSREEAESNDGSSEHCEKTEHSLLVSSKHDAAIPPAYQPVNPYFHNPLNAPPMSGVKYYNIYIDGPRSLKTDDQVFIQYVKDKNATGRSDWYRVTNVTQDNGDGVIVARVQQVLGTSTRPK